MHSTDLSEGSLIAFHHALRAALLTKSDFTLFNVSTDGWLEWDNFPGVRATLERWGVLPGTVIASAAWRRAAVTIVGPRVSSA